MHRRWQFVIWSGCFYELLQFIFKLGHRLLCVYSGKGGKLNLDITAGVLSSKAEFLCYGVVKSPYLNYKWVHCYALTSCYCLGREKNPRAEAERKNIHSMRREALAPSFLFHLSVAW